MAVKEPTRIARKKALEMNELMRMFIDDMKLGPALNTQRIFKAWDEASGAGQFTLKKFFRDGTLYVTTSSSVVRNQLFFQSEALVAKMNKILEEDHLFLKDEPKVGYVKKLILK
ncbi:MAG: DUF721 domain-containing protein [Bacteroidales bacterium]|nr:DUF721 domain-containing protein [Bacteroidales bacterium]